MTIEPTPLADVVAVDAEATRPPEPCAYCPNWRFEYVDLDDGGSVIREWHLATCAAAQQVSAEGA